MANTPPEERADYLRVPDSLRRAVADELIMGDDGDITEEQHQAEMNRVRAPKTRAKVGKVMVRSSDMMVMSAMVINIPGLTVRQSTFLRIWVTNGFRVVPAYRTAFKREGLSEAATRNGAYKLLNTPEMQAAIASIRSEVVKSQAITMKSHLAELAQLRDMAKSTGNIAAAIAAEVARGKVAGFYIERSINKNEPPPPPTPPKLSPAEFAAIAAVVNADV